MFQWSFNYSGPLSGLKAALDERGDESKEGGLKGESLSRFNSARAQIEAQAADNASDVSGRAVSQRDGVDHQPPHEGPAVHIASYGSGDLPQSPERVFFLEVKAFDHTQPEA